MEAKTANSLEIAMSRLVVPNRESALPELEPVLRFVNKRFGFVPNIYRAMSISPKTLTGLTEMQGALARALDVRTRERIALAVSEVNGCHYCLAAHTYLGVRFAKLDAEEMALNRRGRSRDPKAEAAVAFAVKVTQTRGKVEEEDLEAVGAAGYTDAQVVEIVALCAQFFLTNFLANVFDIDSDFAATDEAHSTREMGTPI
jgi:uncharacterized peroxidase-related enzyme